MHKHSLWLVLAIIIGSILWYSIRVWNMELTGDADILTANVGHMLHGESFYNPYPLFIALPAVLSLPFNNPEIGIKLFTIILSLCYIAGTYFLTKTLKFDRFTSLLACLIVSIPLLMPYEWMLETSMVAMLLSGFLALYFVTIKTRSFLPLMALLIGILCLPLLHAQITQAFAIFLIISIVIFWKKREVIAVNSLALFLIATIGLYWFGSVNYYRVPLEFITGNFEAVKSGALLELGQKLAGISTGQRLIEGVTVFHYFGKHALGSLAAFTFIPLMTVSIIRNHKNKEIKLLLYSTFTYGIFYMAYIFRITDAGYWVTMRMLPFIFPLAIVIIALEIRNGLDWARSREKK